MSCVNVDTIGPLTADKFGNQYVIVFIDTFTRFVRLYKAADALSMTAARALVDYCCTFGIPLKIQTDNGPQYAADLIKDLGSLLHLVHEFTVPYSHQENGPVERANKEVGRHLRALLYDNRTTSRWSEELPLVQLILNTKVHHTTGVAPASLVFGGMVDLNRGMFPSLPSPTASFDPPVSYSEYLQDLQAAQQQLIVRAAKHQRGREESIQGRKRARVATEFAKGSFVLMSYPDNRRPNKLSVSHRGPFKVLGTIPSSDGTTPAEYRLFDSSTQKEICAAVHLLRPFHYDPQYTNPETAALADKDVYIVESILNHKPKTLDILKTPKKRLQFLVKYTGQEVAEWNTWANLRTNVKLHEYLRHIGKSIMIPNRFPSEDSP
jgi:hypothetical protein